MCRSFHVLWRPHPPLTGPPPAHNYRQR
jgi:hypothetical protein